MSASENNRIRQAGRLRWKADEGVGLHLQQLEVLDDTYGRWVNVEEVPSTASDIEEFTQVGNPPIRQGS